MILSVPTLIGVILASASGGIVVGIVGKKIYDQPGKDCFLKSNNFTIDISPCHFCRDLEAPSDGLHVHPNPEAYSNPEGEQWHNFLKLHTQ